MPTQKFARSLHDAKKLFLFNFASTLYKFLQKGVYT